MTTSIRPIVLEDLEALKAVLDSCGLFPPELLDDMIADYFQNPDSTDLWLTTVEQDRQNYIAI